MTTKTQTTAPTTAAEAKALADRLAAQEHDIAERRRTARHEAEVAACRELLGDEADRLKGAADQASAAWKAGTEDPDVGLAELFALWQTLRLASAARAAHVAQVSSRWDQLEPIHGQGGGQTTHRADLYDYLDPRGELTFARAIEDVIQLRVEMAKATATSAAVERIQTAGADAAAAVE